MERIVIDSAKCVGCGECVRDCVSASITLEGGKAKVRPGCIGCGHCYAVCPAGAVDMPDCDTSGCGEIASMTEIDSDLLLQAMKSRRAGGRISGIKLAGRNMARSRMARKASSSVGKYRLREALA